MNGEMGQAKAGNIEESVNYTEFPFGKPPLLTPERPFNPFTNNSNVHFGILYYIRLIIIFPIFILRAICLPLVLLLGYTFTKIAMIGASDDLETPLPPWRQKLFWPLRLCSRLFLFFLGYHWINVRGRCASRDIAPIIISNHVTFVEPIYIFFAHFPLFVIAKENLDLPIAGPIMKALKVILVDRINPDSRKIVSDEIQRRANCNDWNHLAIFPEATTTNGRSIVSFKFGAFKPGFAVQPIVVKYPHIKIDPSWVANGPPIHLVFFYLMTQFSNFMEVEYLPIIEPTINDIKNPKAFAERTRTTMAKALNVNVTDHTFADVVLTLEADKLKIEKKLINVEFGQFEKKFKLEVSTAKFFLQKFKNLDEKNNGVIFYEDFLKYFHLSDNWSSKKVFELFDTSQKGYLSFREYLTGVSFILKHEKFASSVEMIFKNVDFDDDGVLNANEKRRSFQFLLPDATDEQLNEILKDMEVGEDGSINLKIFQIFFTKNPEYLAVILTYKPFLI